MFLGVDDEDLLDDELLDVELLGAELLDAELLLSFLGRSLLVLLWSFLLRTSSAVDESSA